MAVKIENLSFAYPDGRQVLKNLSLAIPAGECAAITGKNGSGKSTLAAVLAGLAPAFSQGSVSGYITIDGAAPGAPACVLQNLEAQLLCESVEEEINFFLKYSAARPGLTPRQICAACGVEHLLGRKTRQLSSGEKQRFVIACAIAFADRRLVVFDEPASCLDRDGMEKLAAIIAKLKSEGSCVIVTGHEAGPLDAVANSRWQLADGALIPAAPPPATPQPLKPAPAGGCSPALLSAESLFCQNVKTAINLKVAHGQILGLAGPNGCGKTTLAKTLAGLVPPLNGDILFDGKKANQQTLRQKVKLVLQNPYNQLIYRTAAQNLSAAAQPGGDSLLSEGAEMLGIAPLLERDISKLSFGQAQRTAFLAAALRRPGLIILDESLSALDAEGTAAFAQFADTLAAKGIAIMLISHLEDRLSGICGSIVKIDGNQQHR